MHRILVTVLFAILALTGCTENKRARTFGGNATIKLTCDTKLFDVTWKGDNIWYTVRAMREGEFAETYTFHEDSSWGALEGTVTFVECTNS